MKNKKLLVFASLIFLIALFLGGSYFYKKYEDQRLGFLASKDFSTFVRIESPHMGDAQAKVYVTEFLDPECESCAAFYPYMKEIMKDFQGEIKLVVRYAPFHGNSQLAIRILEAARNQGKYWETLELLFYHLPSWGDHHHPRPEVIWDLLPQLGLDVERIRQEMNDAKITKIIEQDRKDASVLGVRMTPTFFVNGKLVQEFGPLYLREAIANELKNSP